MFRSWLGNAFYPAGVSPFDHASLATKLSSLEQELRTTFRKQDNGRKSLEAISALQSLLGAPSVERIGSLLGARLQQLEIAYKTISVEVERWKTGYQLNSQQASAAEKCLLASREAEAYIAQQQSALPVFIHKKVYIPTLRGLRALPDASSGDLYQDRTRADYFADGDSRIEIITGLGFFDLITDHLLGDLKKRNLIQEYQAWLSRHFFDAKIALIPRLSEKTLYIKIGDEREQPIHNLGDGLQQVLVSTIPIFLFRDSDLALFIEEPEQNLHPGYQRLLINAYTDVASRVRRLQVFVATHSHTFLDITLDSTNVSIYRLSKALPPGGGDEKEASFKIEKLSDPSHSLLKELGVRNSSVLLSNCTIWVEGITDRRYFRKYLELSGTELKEDIHYSFVEYSGNNITHWSFLDPAEGIDQSRVCSRLLLIADQDKKKESRHEALRAALGPRFIKLPVLEVENLLSPAVIKGVVAQYEDPEAKLQNFNRSDYLNAYLGTFIETRVLSSPSARRSKDGHPYSEGSGTLRNKTDFCEKALACLQSDADLTSEAIDIRNQMLEFIKESNK